VITAFCWQLVQPAFMIKKKYAELYFNLLTCFKKNKYWQLS